MRFIQTHQIYNFFIGDTIDTNGAGDAGKVRFQVKTDVAGTITMNELALFIQL